MFSRLFRWLRNSPTNVADRQWQEFLFLGDRTASWFDN